MMDKKFEIGQTVYYIGTKGEFPSIQEALVKPKPTYWTLPGEFIWTDNPLYPHSPTGGRLLMADEVALDGEGAYAMLVDAIHSRITGLVGDIKALVDYEREQEPSDESKRKGI